MADAIETVVETAAQIEEGILDSLERAGYLLGEEDERLIDKPKLRHAIYEHVIRAKVSSKADRRSRAVTKGALTKLVIPDAEDEASDEIGRKVYEGLLRLVWNEANPNHSGTVQSLVGEVTDDNGLSYVLVRTKVSIEGNPTDAVYVTTDFTRIAEDFTSPLGQAVTRAAKKYAINATMLIKRGQDAKKVRKGLDTAMQSAAMLAASTVDLALTDGDGE